MDIHNAERFYSVPEELEPGRSDYLTHLFSSQMTDEPDPEPDDIEVLIEEIQALRKEIKELIKEIQKTKKRLQNGRDLEGY